MTICVGWIGECPVHGISHGCRLDAPHGGKHECRCGSTYNAKATRTKRKTDDQRKNKKRHPDHYKPKYLLRKEGKLP